MRRTLAGFWREGKQAGRLACKQACMSSCLQAGNPAGKQSSKKAGRLASWQGGWHDSLPACRQERLFGSIFPNRAAIFAARQAALGLTFRTFRGVVASRFSRAVLQPSLRRGWPGFGRRASDASAA